MSTHYIEEAERLADTVAIMAHGRAVAAGARASSSPSTPAREAVEVYGPPARLPRSRARRARAGLRTRRTGTSVVGARRQRRAASTASGAPANLEDVFVLLTGEEIA